jgi:hypothetical protein
LWDGIDELSKVSMLSMPAYEQLTTTGRSSLGLSSSFHFSFSDLAQHLDWHEVCTIPCGVEEIDVKPQLIIAFLIAAVLVISAHAQENSSAQDTNTVLARVSQHPSKSKVIRPAQTPVRSGSRDPDASPQATGDDGEDTIVVDVWSTAIQAAPDKLSAGFAAAALNAATRMQFTERRIANSIRMGFPLGEFWIQTDLDSIDDSLRMAALAVTNDADRKALQELGTQTDHLRIWCDWLIEQNRHLRLANYYISPAPLDNDERFQNTVSCTRFLASMLASGRLQEEDRSCR